MLHNYLIDQSTEAMEFENDPRIGKQSEAETSPQRDCTIVEINATIGFKAG